METVDQAITRLRAELVHLEWVGAEPGIRPEFVAAYRQKLNGVNRELERMLRVKAQGLQYEPDF